MDNNIKIGGIEFTTDKKEINNNIKSSVKALSQLKSGNISGATKTALDNDLPKIEKYLSGDSEVNEHIMKRQIIITENQKQRLFLEAASFDRQRGINAKMFRMALKKALQNQEYEYVPQENKLYIDGFTYEIGKKYAENAEGDPIDLHYTFQTVNRYINDMIGDEIQQVEEEPSYDSFNDMEEPISNNLEQVVDNEMSRVKNNF